MSLQTDARDCLLSAVASDYNVNVPVNQLGQLNPSDPRIGAQNGSAWEHTLDAAAKCLCGKGYPTRVPDSAKASALLNQSLTDSQIYLEDLSAAAFTANAVSTDTFNKMVLVGSAVTAAITLSAFAFSLKRALRS